MRSTFVAALVAVLTLTAAPVLAQDEGQTANTTVTVNATGGGLNGAIVAPFDTGTPDERPCETGREITVFAKRTGRGYKMLAATESSSEGTWSVSAPKEDTIYKIRVAEKGFTYSPSYGELKNGTCMPATVVGKKVTARRFKVLSSVLGTRITRGGRAGGAQLPRTGAVPLPFLLFGVSLIGLGVCLARAKGASTS